MLFNFNWSKRMFTKSVSQVVGDLEKKCSQLVSLANDLRAKAEKKHADAQKLLTERDDHRAEASRAERVAAKVGQLLD